VTTLLRELQRRLGGIYDVDAGCDVGEFVTSDRELLPRDVAESGTDEHVMVALEPDALAMSVFIDRRVLERLEAADPLQRLDAGNLADFWTALEGVSHFLCIAWNARHDRDVSVLELEMQADIDKFVLSADLLRRQGTPRVPAALHDLLFRRVRVDERLARHRAPLYRAATHHAARFCRELEGRLRQAAERVQDSVLLPQLRRFYRLADRGKLDYIRAI
jgi:hypothetical protein